MQWKRVPRTAVFGYLVLDVAAVLLYVASDRFTTSSGFGGILAAAWPFLAGLVVGWVVARAWRSPRRVAWTGVIVWLGVVVVGMPVRALVVQPLPYAFVFVSFVAIGLLLLGWRAIGWILDALFGREERKVVDEKYRR